MKNTAGIVNGTYSPPPPLPAEQHSELHPCTGCPRWRGGQGRDELVVDRGSGRIYWRGLDVNLTRAEFRVIEHLIDLKGDFASYRILYDKLKDIPGFIAGQDGNGNSNMRSAIKRIRRKFVRVDPQWDNIQNYQAFGYAWRRPCP